MKEYREITSPCLKFNPLGSTLMRILSALQKKQQNKDKKENY